MSLLFFFAAFAGGAVLAFLEYRLAGWFLKRHERSYPLVSVIRQLINVAYLLALFFIGRNPDANRYALLIGGALGMTIPAFWLTAKLVRQLDQTKETQTERRDDNG